MVEAKDASFSFEMFKVSRFSYDEENQVDSNVKMVFKPSGIYNPKTGEFELKLIFATFNPSGEKKHIFDLTAIAIFKFTEGLSLEKLPDYFYKNAIAIMFPYLRAFVSTLTLQANTSKILKLGLMNLSGLEEHFRKNTVEAS